MANVCGTGGWKGPLPGDPDNNSILTATTAEGGIDLRWTFPLTNPFAVAHTLVFRSSDDNLAHAIRLAVVNGSFYFDRIDTNNSVQYYYWIQLVSVNGTYNDPIGPVQATALPSLQQWLDKLTGALGQHQLGEDLKARLDRIVLLETNLAQEILDRVDNDTALGSLYNQIQDEILAARNDLLSRITDLDAADDALIAAVNANTTAIGSERAERLQALIDEAQARVAALQAEAGARVAAIASERQERISQFDSLVSQLTTLTAAQGKLSADLLLESQARATADTAMASQITALVAADADQTAALQTESTARIQADQSLASQITTLSAAVDDNAAAITAEATARATAVDALATQIDQMGVSLAEDFTADLLVERQARIDGDAAAASQLTALGSDFAGLAADLITEQTARATADSALASDLSTLNARTTDIEASVQSEAQARIDNDMALASQLSALLVEMDDVQAALLTEQLTRATEDTALAAQLQTLSATVDGNQAQVQGQLQALAGEDEALALQMQALAVSLEQGDATLTAAVQSESVARVTADQALASEIDQLQAVVDSNAAALTSEATVRATEDAALSAQLTALVATVDDNHAQITQEYATLAYADGAVGRAVTTVTVNGRQAVFGINVDGQLAEIGAVADRFYVYNPVGGQYIPAFVVQNGEVSMPEAFIKQLTFDKLRDGAGGLLVQDGKLKSQYIQADQLVVGYGQVQGLGSLATRDSVSYGEVTGLKPPVDATRNVFRGPWLENVSYLVGDQTVYGDYGWSCTADHISSNLIRPPSDPAQSNAWWVLSSVKGSPAKQVQLTASALVFKVDKQGQGTPVDIEFTATGQAVTGEPVFEVIEGAASLSGTGTSRTLNYGAMLSDSVTVRVTWDGQTDLATVVKVHEGLDAVHYDVKIESTNGDQFRVGQSTQTLLKARVFRNGVDVTDEIPADKFGWMRVSYYPQPAPNDDATWNALYASGYKQIQIDVDSVYARATFHCYITD